jgi:2-polyprenyl-6-methoxyphenol hydroxylase-like FAD-dependent oxidoreductase
LLARAGLRVLVLERAQRGADTISTHALMRTGVLQLHRWGLLERLHAAGPPPIRRTVFHYESGDSARITLKPSAGVDALYAPRRTVLDTLLVDAALEAGAQIRFGVRVTDLIVDQGRVLGVVAVDGGSTQPFRATLTVGADGLRSSVAALAGARTERVGSARGAVLYAYVDGLEADGYEWFYAHHTAAGFIPTNDGQVCVFVGAPADRLRALQGSPADRHAHLVRTASPAAAARLAQARRAGQVRGFPGVRGYFRQSHGAGWALVGDAGYFKDPLSTHGMSDAFRDAELLARAVIASQRGDVEIAAALAAYQRERDRLSADLFDVTDRIAGYGWQEADLRRDLLRLSSAMSDEVEALLALDDVDAAGRSVA